MPINEFTKKCMIYGLEDLSKNILEIKSMVEKSDYDEFQAIQEHLNKIEYHITRIENIR